MGGSGTWRETGLGPPPKDRQSGRRGGRGEQGRGAGRGWPVPPAAPAAAPLVAGPLPRSQTFVVVPGPPHAVPSGALPREPVALTVCGHWLPTPPGSSGPGSTSGTAVGTSSTGQARGAAPPAPGGLGGWASARPAGGRGARARRRAGRSRGGADGHVEAVCTWLQTVRTCTPSTALSQRQRPWREGACGLQLRQARPRRETRPARVRHPAALRPSVISSRAKGRQHSWVP